MKLKTKSTTGGICVTVFNCHHDDTAEKLI